MRKGYLIVSNGVDGDEGLTGFAPVEMTGFGWRGREGA
jgi:hypothetical protein